MQRSEDLNRSSATIDSWVAQTKTGGRNYTLPRELSLVKTEAEFQKQGIIFIPEDHRVPISNIISLSKGALEEKSIGLKALEQLDLPRLKSVTITAENYLQNPESVYEKLDSKKYYVILPPKDGQRRRKFDLTEEDTEQYIKSNLPFEGRANANVQILEYFDNIYSGNIMVNTDGSVTMEMGRGKHSYIVSGSKTPEVILERRAGSRSLTGKQAILKPNANGEEEIVGWQTMTPDDPLYKLMVETFIKIPPPASDEISPQTLDTNPGYYEVALVQKPGTNFLKPIFLDFKDAYNNPTYSTSVVK